MGNGEKILRVNVVELCVETFGDPGAPAILLIGGSGASMVAGPSSRAERGAHQSAEVGEGLVRKARQLPGRLRP